MNKSQRNAKAKAKGLRQAKRKKKLNTIKNKERKEDTFKGKSHKGDMTISGSRNKYLDGVASSSSQSWSKIRRQS